MKCYPVGGAWVFSINLSLLVGCPRVLRGGTSLLDMVDSPICEMGQQWLLQGCCAVNELLGGRALQKCKWSTYLLLIIDIFIHCNKQSGNSRVMVDSADLQVSASTVGSCGGRKKELLDLQLSSVYAGGHLKKFCLSRPRNISMIWLKESCVCTRHLLEWKQNVKLIVILNGFPGWSCIQLKMVKEDTTAGCSLASRD